VNSLVITLEPNGYHVEFGKQIPNDSRATVWLAEDGEIVEYQATFSTVKEARLFCREATGR
jgi:hypothetical protein